jgi:hypothetical protein
MGSNPWVRPKQRSWIFSVAGVAIAVLIVVGVGPQGVLLQRVTVCQLGAEIGSYSIWTPYVLLNQPDQTEVSMAAETNAWNYTFTSGSLTTGALPVGSTGSWGGFGNDGPSGGVLAEFQDSSWTFYHAVNKTVIGNSPGPCTQPYVAKVGASLGCGGLLTIPLYPNNSTDSNEPHIWNSSTAVSGTWGPGCPVQTPGTYVWFDNSYSANGVGNYAPVDLNLCGWNSTYPLWLDGTARIPVIVTVPYQGRDVSASGFISWYGQPNAGPPLSGQATGITAYYALPGGWNWSLAPVGPAAFPINPGEPLPGLIAFERSAC